MSPVVITGTITSVRVRLNSCPGCGKPLVLDHAGAASDSGEPDPDRVVLAQRLHFASCSG